MVEEVVAWVGSGVRAQPPDAAVVVIFLAIPGAGKGALCAALADMLPPEHYAVQHIESDAQAGRRSTFWPAVTAQAVTHRGDGRATVVLADKNAIDSPPGNLDSIAETVGAAGVPVVTVGFGQPMRHGRDGDAGETARLRPALPDLLTAICMLRVLRRKNHAVMLTGEDNEEALQIVNNFAAVFAGVTAARLRQRAACFGGHHIVAPALLAHPPVEDGDTGALREVQGLVEEAAAFGGFGGKFTPVSAAWEARMRACLTRPDVSAALDRQQPALRDTAATIAHKVAAVLRRPVAAGVPAAEAAAGQAPLALRDCEYIAVADLPAERLCAAWASVRAAAPAAPAAARLRSELHVTLWHCREVTSPPPDATAEGCEAREAAAERRGEAALAAVGDTVAVHVLGFDCCETAVAARVELEGAAAGLQDVPRPHATLWHAAGVPAKAAGRVRERVAAGEEGAVFLKLEEEITVQGTVRAVEAQ